MIYLCITFMIIRLTSPQVSQRNPSYFIFTPEKIYKINTVTNHLQTRNNIVKTLFIFRPIYFSSNIRKNKFSCVTYFINGCEAIFFLTLKLPEPDHIRYDYLCAQDTSDVAHLARGALVAQSTNFRMHIVQEIVEGSVAKSASTDGDATTGSPFLHGELLQ